MTLEIKVVEDLAKLSHVIWYNSELAQEKFKTHDTITEFLDNYKFPQVDRKFILPTGFRAVDGDKAKRTTCGTLGRIRCPV